VAELTLGKYSTNDLEIRTEKVIQPTGIGAPEMAGE